jgi:hypothetical protein
MIPTIIDVTEVHPSFDDASHMVQYLTDAINNSPKSGGLHPAKTSLFTHILGRKDLLLLMLPKT